MLYRVNILDYNVLSFVESSMFQTLVQGIFVSSYMQLLDKEVLDLCVLLPLRLWLFSPGDRVEEEESREDSDGDDNLLVDLFLYCDEDDSRILFRKFGESEDLSECRALFPGAKYLPVRGSVLELTLLALSIGVSICTSKLLFISCNSLLSVLHCSSFASHLGEGT